MSKTKSKFSKRSSTAVSLNEDRGDASWQYERGPRYGNSRKAKALQKRQQRKTERSIPSAC